MSVPMALLAVTVMLTVRTQTEGTLVRVCTASLATANSVMVRDINTKSHYLSYKMYNVTI